MDSRTESEIVKAAYEYGKQRAQEQKRSRLKSPSPLRVHPKILAAIIRLQQSPYKVTYCGLPLSMIIAHQRGVDHGR